MSELELYTIERNERSSSLAETLLSLLLLLMLALRLLN